MGGGTGAVVEKGKKEWANEGSQKKRVIDKIERKEIDTPSSNCVDELTSKRANERCISDKANSPIHVNTRRRPSNIEGAYSMLGEWSNSKREIGVGEAIGA